ncbi:MAG: shikimate kinase [Proteobacteria bacterium]|nr:MAG: shikimate kinase [Pseudomonadota bacterium]
MQDTIILVGLMGAGKSTIGRQLAKRYHLDFIDTDKVIEERTGVPITTIFEIEGEDGFRDREEQVIRELAGLPGKVIATGGGSVIRAINRECIKSATTVIYLRASAEQLYSRIRHDRSRPLMQSAKPLETLRKLLQIREPYYLEVATIVMPTGRQKIPHILNVISQQLNQLQLGQLEEFSHANPKA